MCGLPLEKDQSVERHRSGVLGQGPGLTCDTPVWADPYRGTRWFLLARLYPDSHDHLPTPNIRPAVEVTLVSGYDNVPPTVFTSYVQSTSKVGNLYVRDQWGYHFVVSPSCVRPLGYDAVFSIEGGRLVATPVPCEGCGFPPADCECEWHRKQLSPCACPSRSSASSSPAWTARRCGTAPAASAAASAVTMPGCSHELRPAERT